MRFTLLFGLFSLFSGSAYAAKTEYLTAGSCGGLPRVSLSTPPGFCVGLVAKGFKFPRGVQALPDGRILVIDMGGWARKRGTLWILEKSGDSYSRTRLLSGLDEPHGVRIGPDGKIYISEVSRVVRLGLEFSKSESDAMAHVETVLTGIPDTGRHPLHSFVFDKEGSLILNVGSATDHCENSGNPPNPSQPCAEAEGENPRGALLKFPRDPSTHAYGKGHLIAKGLRNSVALAVHPQSGILIQGENSRDSINRADPKLDDRELPHDEINLIEEGANYGWPYCYDENTPSPEFPGFDCSKTQPPSLLIPAHTAPLGMTYYTGKLFPVAYRGMLLITYHGYRDYGHRVVALSTDSEGRVSHSSKSFDLIWDWARTDSHPMGTPVELSQSSDGAVFITEDKNGDLLRLNYDPRQGDGALTPSVFEKKVKKDTSELARCEAIKKRNDLFSHIQTSLIDTSCISCHGDPTAPAGNLLLQKCDDIGNAKRLLEKHAGGVPLVTPCDLTGEFMQRLKGIPGVPQMPIGGKLSDDKIALVHDWIIKGAPEPGVQPKDNACQP